MQKFKIDNRLQLWPTPTDTETDCDIDRHWSRPPATPTPTDTETDCDYDQNRPRPRQIATLIDDQGRLHTFTWFPAHYQALMKSSSLLSARNSLWYAIRLQQRQEWKLEEFTGVVWHQGVGSKRHKRFWGNAKVHPTFGEDTQSRFRPFCFHIYCFSLDLGSLLCFPFQ